MAFSELIKKLSEKFYPKGRAFATRRNGVKERLHKALGASESRAYSDAIKVLDGLLPDTDNFTEEDASDWERRLGLITNPFVPLDERKLAIERKIQHPGTIKPRQHYKYMEGQLRAAGFDVVVTENRFAADSVISAQMGVFDMGDGEMGGEVSNPNKWEVIDPYTLLSDIEQMGLTEMGVGEMGGYYSASGFEIVANNIPAELDQDFYDDVYQAEMGEGEMGEMLMGHNLNWLEALRSTFFISGSPFPSLGTVSLDRKDEFRQMILRLKPANTVGFLFINFVGDDYNIDYNDDFNSEE